MTNKECCERLDRVSVIEDPLCMRQWLPHKCQMTTYTTYMEVPVSIDREEVRHLTDEKLTALIDQRIKSVLRDRFA